MAMATDKIFRTFTEVSPCVGHEMSHGVVQFAGGLVYRGKSGALNESFADVLRVPHPSTRRPGRAPSEADWLIGKGILGPDYRGVALQRHEGSGYRLRRPAAWKATRSLTTWISSSRRRCDNGGVHMNSGIPNHAFYLYSQYLGGNAGRSRGKVLYDAMLKDQQCAGDFQRLGAADA